MRRFVVLAVICTAACGRLGFDEAARGSGSQGPMLPGIEDGVDAGPGGSSAWPSGPGCIDDSFATDFSARWTTWSDAVDVTAQNLGEALVIQKTMQTEGGYAGAYSTARFDLTDGSISVEVPQVMDAVVALYLTTTTPSLYYTITHDGGQLRGTRVDPPYSEGSGWFTYQPGPHRFWRIAHSSAAADQVSFSTSMDGVTWQQFKSLTDTVPVTSLRVDLSAGTYYGGSLGGDTARLDNLTLCTTR